MELPMLYKKTSVGKIQVWSISTVESTIITISGQMDGKMITSTDTVTDGKNAGKKNETTASQQAELEAKAKWTKQLKTITKN